MSGPNSINQLWKDIATGCARLLGGEPVAIPTETVYGLAARIDDSSAVTRVFELKERPFFDPLIVHLESSTRLHDVVKDVAPLAAHLAARLWPGPLTMVLPRKDTVNPMICSGLDTVAVRVPAHPVARRILRRVGVPLAAPSANRFGKTSPTTAAHVRGEWPDGSVFVVDAGPCPVGIESTVVDFGSGAAGETIRVLRPGMITEAELSTALRDYAGSVSIAFAESVASPGHLPYHYQPSIPLVIASAGQLPLSRTACESLAKRLALPGTAYATVELDANPMFAARTLYASLRQLALSGADFLIVERKSQHSSPEWRAVWDRLERAATLRDLHEI